jgi:hypothetical protein
MVVEVVERSGYSLLEGREKMRKKINMNFCGIFCEND